ncbi:hypothetical protein [Sulfurihydrogenibium sp.]|jgi:hypothetical protein|uniref:hypothetical protein n=1 Tax=Sulfurihydrogenibium sp. TaxID=2053621 RepID=UPI0026313D18|nr:hypothetical protein [Sulfurihydrogenibium sp.]
MNNKGFALVSVLVLGFVISLIGGATFLVAKNGFLITGSQVRYNIAEKAADYGISYYIDGYTANKSPFADSQCNCPNNSYCVCTLKPNPNSNDPVATVRIISLNNTFIIHSTGTYQGATVVKIASANTVLKTIPNTNIGKTVANMGAVMMTKITNISGLGTSTSASLAACDNSCPAAAMILGSPLPQGQQVTTSQCKNNNNGVASNSDSPILIKDGSNGTEQLTPDKIYSTYFSGVNSRNDLFNKFQNMYGIAFNSNNEPVGFTSSNSITITDQQSSLPANGSSYDLCNFGQNANVGTAVASGNTITTSSSWNISGLNCQAKPTFTWDGSKYVGTLNCYGNGNKIVSTTTFYCNKIDFGWNATLNISNFSGGGGLAAGSINMGDVNGSPLTLVGKNQINMTSNGIDINSPVYMFAKNYNIDANNLHIKSSSIIASLGNSSNLNMTLKGNSNIGTQDNPALIISDNNINIQGNGSNEINGLIFSTGSNNNFSLNISGNYTINGSVGSASGSNNNINMSGNSQINFNSSIIQNLSNKFSGLVNPPQCGATVTVPVVNLSINTQKINFKTTVQTLY